MRENQSILGDLKSNIEDNIEKLQKAVQSDDEKKIQYAINDLQSALHEVSARMYGQQPGQEQPYGGTPPGGMGGRPKTQDEMEEEQYRKATGQDVVDAEYE